MRIHLDKGVDCHGVVFQPVKVGFHPTQMANMTILCLPSLKLVSELVYLIDGGKSDEGIERLVIVEARLECLNGVVELLQCVVECHGACLFFVVLVLFVSCLLIAVFVALESSKSEILNESNSRIAALKKPWRRAC